MGKQRKLPFRKPRIDGPVLSEPWRVGRWLVVAATRPEIGLTVWRWKCTVCRVKFSTRADAEPFLGCRCGP